MSDTSLVPRPICGRRKNGLVSIVCACAEYPTIRGVSDLYVNSPCNFPLYFTHTARFRAPEGWKGTPDAQEGAAVCHS